PILCASNVQTDPHISKLHTKQITSLLIRNDLLVSTSMDGIVKFWKLEIKDGTLKIEQVGEFYCKSPILCAKFSYSQTSETIVIVADQYGHVNIIKWC
ncbi:hypothetical protein, partial [Salmonella sp. s51228]|uniref:hypothetical protein n=1 Tax=Salmonella sp. s51228 TaxID=3159652 RepID=UPI00397FA03A